MHSFEIIKLDLIKDNKIIDQIREIFLFHSSVKNFKSDVDKNYFIERWLGVYIKNYSDSFYCAVSSQKVLGYLCLCEDTFSFIDKYGSLGGQDKFANELNDFPAHLHINVRETGNGVGAKLIEAATLDLKSANISGVHIITSPQSKNVSFYKKNGFLYSKEHILNEDVTLFFMGKSI